MPSITVKNIPESLFNRLKAAAERNRRSLNGEIITRIEDSLAPRRVPTEVLLARIRELHERYEGPALPLEEIDDARRAGRP